jgi:Predicted amidohydrolase
MARYLKISVLGQDIYLADPVFSYEEAIEKMIDYWKDQLSQVLPDKPDLIITPEACDCPPGYPIEKELEYYKARGNRVRDFMCGVAARNNCNIAYSSHREMADGTWRNSTQIINRNGNIAGIYDKNNLIIPENTESGILYGKDAPVIKCDFGSVACAICFDLNFDELRMKYVKAKPDLIIFSSMYHGGLMQSYWAYSCRAHFTGAVQGLPCSIISPVGEIVASSTNYHKYVTSTVNLDCAVVHLDYNWDRLKVAKAKYGSDLKITDPGYLGSVLISSESVDFVIGDIIREYDIELLDDYFNRSIAHRSRNLEP